MVAMNIQLSDQQNQIVQEPTSTFIQVLASAGSGKTRVLTERIRYLLSNSKREGVIALTFTNKAATEMKERLEQNETDEDRVWVGTIHSVAQRILEQYGHTISLPPNVQIFERDKDRMEVFLEALRENGVNIDEYLSVENPKEKKNRERNLQNYMDAFSAIKREMFSEQEASEKLSDTPDVWRVYTDYQNALLNSGGIDYDDILRYAHRILLTQSWVADIYRAKYGFICVDEAQDLNRVQYEFVKALAGKEECRIMMVGDPDQMIYGFNGSDSKYLCQEFPSDFSVTTFRLIENYRSSKAVVRAANSLRPGAQRESEFAIEGTVKLESHASEEDEATWIVASIQNLINLKNHSDIEGVITPENMVVIARNRFVFSKLEEELSKANIEYRLKIGEREKLPESRFGQALDLALRVKLNPSDWIDGRKLCQLLDIESPSHWGQEGQLKQFCENLKAKEENADLLIRRLLVELDLMDNESPNILKFEKLFEGIISNIATDESDEMHKLEMDRSLVELREFSERWTLFRRLGLGKTLSAFRNAMALGKLKPDTIDNGLTLSTVHTMKGLEKDIVFLMGFCEGTFPDYRATSVSKIEEEKNTAFVAVTRARRWLFISYPRSRIMPWNSVRSQNPSRFISEMGLDFQTS